MVARNKRYTRIGERYTGRVVRWIVLLLVSIGIFILVISLPQAVSFSYGVLEYGNPIRVVWWNNDSQQFAELILPADAYSDADSRYDQYSLEALWKLGSIDKNNRMLANRIISQSINLPIKWYIYNSSPEGRNNWNILDLFKYRQNNMPLKLYLTYIWNRVFNSANIQTYDLTGSYYLTGKKLPDGRKVYYLNSDAISGALDHDLEMESIRKENLKIAVFNATNVAGLGDKVSQMLGTLGIYVGNVSNISTPVGTCQIIGSESSLRSYTVSVIDNLFGCKQITRESDNVYDLEITVGDKLYPFGN